MKESAIQNGDTDREMVGVWELISQYKLSADYVASPVRLRGWTKWTKDYAWQLSVQPTSELMNEEINVHQYVLTY